MLGGDPREPAWEHRGMEKGPEWGWAHVGSRGLCAIGALRCPTGILRAAILAQESWGKA